MDFSLKFQRYRSILEPKTNLKLLEKEKKKNYSWIEIFSERK